MRFRKESGPIWAGDSRRVKEPAVGSDDMSGILPASTNSGQQQPERRMTEALFFLRYRAEWPMPRRIEMARSLVRSTAPGTPRWQGKLTPAARRLSSQETMVWASKHICVAM